MEVRRLTAISFKISFVQAVLSQMPHDDKNADLAWVRADYMTRSCLALQACLKYRVFSPATPISGFIG